MPKTAAATKDGGVRSVPGLPERSSRAPLARKGRMDVVAVPNSVGGSPGGGKWTVGIIDPKIPVFRSGAPTLDRVDKTALVAGRSAILQEASWSRWRKVKGCYICKAPADY